MEDGLLLRGSRIVTPLSVRQDVLSALHSSHQGGTKCRDRPRQAVWWPGIGEHIKELVSSCPTCCIDQKLPWSRLYTPFPIYPWQKGPTDLFEWKGNDYLLVIDYYFRYMETALALLTSTTSRAIINHLKAMFARQGPPKEVFSDNGPQFSFEAFASCASEFRHTTSSPRFPQANGEAERAVATVKAFIRKCEDPYMALLSYRSTQLSNV